MSKPIYLAEATVSELLAEVERRFDERAPLPEWAQPVVVAVATYYGMPVELLRGRRKDDVTARTRHLAIAMLAQFHPTRSRAEVCAVLGVEHHMYAHALRRIEERVRAFADFRGEVGEIVKIVRETTGRTPAAACGSSTRSHPNALAAG
jgi:chromosomal replication initiation ATPase DnaA